MKKRSQKRLLIQDSIGGEEVNNSKTAANSQQQQQKQQEENFRQSPPPPPSGIKTKTKSQEDPLTENEGRLDTTIDTNITNADATNNYANDTNIDNNAAIAINTAGNSSKRRSKRQRHQQQQEEEEVEHQVPASISIPSKKKRKKSAHKRSMKKSSHDRTGARGGSGGRAGAAGAGGGGVRGGGGGRGTATNSSLTMKLLGSQQPFSPGAGHPQHNTAMPVLSGGSNTIASTGVVNPSQNNNTHYNTTGEKILAPHVNDILCGRGGSINAHPGNRVFRSWVQDRKSFYNLASTKAEKSRVVNEILQMVRDLRPPGRFLQKVSPNSASGAAAEMSMIHCDEGWWEEIDEIKAMAKISQALREGAPAFRAAHGKGKGSDKKEGGPARRRSSTGGGGGQAAAAGGGSGAAGGGKVPKQGKRKSATEKHITFDSSPKVKRRSSKAGANASSSDAAAKATVPALPPVSNPLASNNAMDIDDDDDVQAHLEIGELGNIFSFNNNNALGTGSNHGSTHSGHGGGNNGNGSSVNGNNNNNNSGNGQVKNKNISPLDPHPLVPTSDFKASIADVAAAIPPTPPAVKKQLASLGNVITPHLQPMSSTPPPVSPYAGKTGGGGGTTSSSTAPGLMSPPAHNWDPLAFFSPTTPKALTTINNNNISGSSSKIGDQSLIKTPNSFYMNRAHSLSLSDLNDFHGSELGEFTNPFENEDELKQCAKNNNTNHNANSATGNSSAGCFGKSSNHNTAGCASSTSSSSKKCGPLTKPPHLDIQMRRHSLNFLPGYTHLLPPPYMQTSSANNAEFNPSHQLHVAAPPYNLPLGAFPPPSPMDSLPPRGLSFGRLGSVPMGSYLGRKSSSSFSRDSCHAGGGGMKQRSQEARRYDSSSSEKDSKPKSNGVSNNFLCYEHFRSFNSDSSDTKDVTLETHHEHATEEENGELSDNYYGDLLCPPCDWGRTGHIQSNHPQPKKQRKESQIVSPFPPTKSSFNDKTIV